MAELLGYPVYDCFGESLIRTIGSFWYHYFGDRDKLELHYRSLGHRQGQAYLDYLTAVATVKLDCWPCSLPVSPTGPM